MEKEDRFAPSFVTTIYIVLEINSRSLVYLGFNHLL